MEENMTSRPTALIFARVSSTTDRQNTERQVRDLQRYADANHLQVVGIYEEKISGGKSNQEREVLQEALRFARTNSVDFILASELSRIGRSVFNTMETIKFLVDNHINLYLQKERFTLLEEDGKPSAFAAIMLATLSCAYELEKSSIAFRLSSGRAKFVSEGGVLGRPKKSFKSKEKKETEYADVLKQLRSTRKIPLHLIAEHNHCSLSTVKRLKREFSL